MTGPAPHHRVDSVIASAGTGKTYRLVEEVAAAVTAGLAPHRVLATTFTNKVAAELLGRIRTRFIKHDRAELAAAMLSARIGTVNSVCGSLIAEFAFELGRSPVAEIIPEERRARLFSRATGGVIEEFAPAIAPLAERLSVPARDRQLAGRSLRGWQDEVRRMVDLARSNGLTPDRMAGAAARSTAGLVTLLPPAEPGETADSLDQALADAVAACCAGVNQARATLKATTIKALAPLEAAEQALARGEPVIWADWARLAKLDTAVAKADQALFTHITAAAVAHARHPRLKSDLADYIRLLFDCAARAMEAYAAYKSERGLLDFVDQELLALETITNPANADRLAELIGAVFVDEFQDSSPIQIALFSALSRIAGRNLWVGDPKQSIYGFRDADPALTNAAASAVTTDTGGTVEYLRKSWRMRPQLGAIVNAAFLPNFARFGMAEPEITFDDYARSDGAEAAPALSTWDVSGRNKAVRAELLARRVAGLLDDPAAWPVDDGDGGLRPARGGDIAILCRSNAQVGELAGALAARSLRVAVERAGLLDQPESELVLAALRWVADRSDTLALAELARLATDSDQWFAAAFAAEPEAALVAQLPIAAALAAIRDGAPQLTPAEVLDAILHIDGVLETIARWGDTEQRLQNIEALRAMIAGYQDEQRTERQAATLGGACAWLAERDDACQPETQHPQAVNILTYHGAKGLEWPIVILTELDAAAKGSPFGLSAEDESPPDWRDPLAARTLRYWPWPYGEQAKGVGLDVTGPASPQGQAALHEERLERVRLLCVGMTRARDHLALALTGGAQALLDELQDDAGNPLVRPADTSCAIGATTFPTRAAPAPLGDDEPSAPAVEFGRLPIAAATHAPLRRRPSDAVAQAPSITEAVALGERIVLVGDPDLQRVGEAFHRFFAADDHVRDRGEREMLATQILTRWGVPQLTGNTLVAAADRLHVFLSERFGDAVRTREWPVHAVDGLQVIAGQLDLLVDLGDGYAVIDHKSFPGSVALDSERLQAFGGQVGLYAAALARVTGRTRFEYWIHQPVAARMTRIDLA